MLSWHMQTAQNFKQHFLVWASACLINKTTLFLLTSMKLWIYVFVNATRIYLLLELNAEIFSWKKNEASLNALLLKRHFVFGNRTWKGTLIFPTIVPGLKPMYIIIWDLNSASQPCCNYFDLLDLLLLVQTSAHKIVPHSKATYSVWAKSSHHIPCFSFLRFLLSYQRVWSGSNYNMNTP